MWNCSFYLQTSLVFLKGDTDIVSVIVFLRSTPIQQATIRLHDTAAGLVMEVARLLITYGLNAFVGHPCALHLPENHPAACSFFFFPLPFQNSPDFRKYSWCLVSGREQKSLSARHSEKYSCPPRKRVYVSGRRGHGGGLQCIYWR